MQALYSNESQLSEEEVVKRHQVAVFLLKNFPVETQEILSSISSTSTKYYLLNNHLPDLLSTKFVNAYFVQGIFECLFRLRGSNSYNYTERMLLAKLLRSKLVICLHEKIEWSEIIKQSIKNEPFGLISLMIYHEIMLQGQPHLFKLYSSQDIKLKYMPDIFTDLLNINKLTRAEFSQININLQQLGNYDYVPANDISDAMHRLNQIQPTYDIELDYPAFLTKHVAETAASKAKQPEGLSRLVPSLYAELGITRSMYSNDEANGMKFNILEEKPSFYVDSLSRFLSNRQVSLPAFSNLPELHQQAPLKTLCAIALHSDLPDTMKQNAIYLIDRVSSLEYVPLTEASLKHEKPIINKPRSISSFFIKNPPSSSTNDKSQSSADAKPSQTSSSPQI